MAETMSERLDAAAVQDTILRVNRNIQTGIEEQRTTERLLATRTGIALDKLEAGDSDWRISELSLIAHRLGVDVEHLLQ